MRKRILPALLSVVLFLALLPPSNAAGTTPYIDADGNQFDFIWDAETDSWTLTKFTPGPNPKNIVIPSTVDGKPVKVIQYLAFADQPDIETVQFPDTLTTIEARAFWNCTGLTQVDIPNSVTRFGSKTLEEGNMGLSGQVFAGCTSLKDISLGTGASDFYRAFEGTAVETAVVPSTVNESLNAQATIMPYTYQTCRMYLNCKSLKTAYVEPGVKELRFTFQGCDSLTALYLPTTVTDLKYTFGTLSHPIDIYYEGSQTDFAQVKVSDEFKSFATVHYNSYTPDQLHKDAVRNMFPAKRAADILHELGLFNGVGNDPSGNPIYSFGRAPTRYEAVTMLVRLLGKEEEAQSGVWTTPFTDVTEWAKPYVGYAYAHGLTNGVSDTRFGGSGDATLVQYATFILRALGYTSGVDFQWDAPWELLSKTGVLQPDVYWGTWESITTEWTKADFYREDVVMMSFLALTAKAKGTDTPLIETILGGDSVGAHTHSFKTYTLPNGGFYMHVPVTQTKEYFFVESHCNTCGYITYDTDDLRAHQGWSCSGQTLPESSYGLNRPWYSSERMWWLERFPAVDLRICTVCGKME